MHPMAQLKAVNISKSYYGRKVVKDVSIEIASGEVVGLLGPNGAGKTTSFYMCVGLVAPDSGRITLDDQDITTLPVFQRARSGLAYLPQEPSIFRKLTVFENVMAILETIDFPDNKARIARADELLSELGLNKVRNSIASSLSGGERRRAEITRALACNPSFILLDEPFAGIDPIAIEDIQQIIITLKKKNIGILITDHNVRETLGICDRAYILVDGKILVSGDSTIIASSQEARRYYLGENFTF